MDGIAQLGINGIAVLTYIVNFGVIYFIIYKFVIKPLIKWMDARRELITSNINEVQELKKNFETALQKEREEHTEKVNAMIQDMSDAKNRAEVQAQQIIADAQIRKDEIMNQADQEVVLAKKQALDSLEEQLLQKVISITLVALRTESSPEKVATIIRQQWKERTY